MKLSKILNLIKKDRLKSSQGFSLVELMVVVAIIGILAAIAIPNFQRYQSRSRQTEARTTLGGLYTSEKIFASEWNYLSADLGQIGFALDGTSNTRYSAGWRSDSDTVTRSDAGYNGPPPSASPNYHTVATVCPKHTNICDPAQVDGVLDDAFATGSGVNVYKPGSTADTCTAGCNCGGSNGVKRCGTATNATGCNGTCATLWSNGKLKKTEPGRVFVIGATGDIGGTQADEWWIDSTKRIINVKNGID